MTELTLGMKVRDKITGFVGTAVQRCDSMGGITDFGVQGEVGADEELPKAAMFVGDRLETLDGEALTVAPIGDTEIVFGVEYVDTISGFKGFATQRLIHVNGCVQWALFPAVSKKGKARPGYFFDDDRLVRADTKEKAVSVPAPRGYAFGEQASRS